MAVALPVPHRLPRLAGNERQVPRVRPEGLDAMSRELVDLLLKLHHKTERAILVSETGEEKKAVWIPLSHCEVELRRNGMVNVTMPEWMAIEKGLV